MTSAGAEASLCGTGAWFETPLLAPWFYEVAVVGMRVAGQLLDLPCTLYNSHASIVDSGTTNLQLPPKVRVNDQPSYFPRFSHCCTRLRNNLLFIFFVIEFVSFHIGVMKIFCVVPRGPIYLMTVINQNNSCLFQVLNVLVEKLVSLSNREMHDLSMDDAFWRGHGQLCFSDDHSVK